MMSAKKVVMILSNPFISDPRVYKEAKSLRKAGYEVVILAWDRECLNPRREIIDGIEVRRIRLKAAYGNPFNLLIKLPIFYIMAILEIVRLKFDTIHTHDFDTAFLGLLFQKIKRKKWIFDIHDIYFDRISMEGSNMLKDAIVSLFSKLEVIFAKMSDIVIVPTRSIGGSYEGLKEFYSKKGVPPEKIAVIWNSPDFSLFNEEKYLRSRKEKRDRKPFTIGYIGSIRTVSGFVPLLEAILEFGKEYKLLLVGGGTAIRNLKKIVSMKYRHLNVEFTGPVPYKRVIEYYAQSDVIYVYYPIRENIKRGLAVKMLEAVGFGIPVIIPAGTLMEDFVNEYKCGVAFNGASVEELKRCLIKVKRIRFNPQLIRKKWNWKNEEYKLVKIYEAIFYESSSKGDQRS